MDFLQCGIIFDRIMKELAIDGKKYVKASAIAKDLGYTSDYVGQLCRGGKIDAQLVAIAR